MKKTIAFRSGKLSVVLFMIFYLAVSTVNGSELKLASDPWCPYTCEPNSNQPGFMVELAEHILEKYGIKINYQVKPWKRVLIKARSGVIDGAITVDQSDSKGLILNTIPFTSTIQTIVTRKNDAFQWNGIQSIRKRIFIAINGYTYGKAVHGWMEENRETGKIISLSGQDALTRSLLMLSRKRGDFTINDLNVLKYTVFKMNKDLSFNYSPTGLRTELFIGISQKRKDAQKIADYLDSGLSSHEIISFRERLLEKYHIR